MAGVFRANLVLCPHTPEMPVDIIGWSNILSHGFILQRNYKFSRSEITGSLHGDITWTEYSGPYGEISLSWNRSGNF
jgi:hypothetical protein